MCHIGLPATNRNWGYCTAAFLSGSWTDDANGAHDPSPCPRMARLLRRKIHETRGLDIRLSSSSTRTPGILLKILVLNVRFKVANYAKSWFHGHSCSVLPITTARRRLLRFLCAGRCCGLSLPVSMSLWRSAETSGLITPSHPHQAAATTSRIPGLYLHLFFRFHNLPSSCPFSWFTNTWSNMLTSLWEPRAQPTWRRSSSCQRFIASSHHASASQFFLVANPWMWVSSKCLSGL